MKLKLAFTCGDPSGVGPEVIAAWLAAKPGEATDVAVIGPPLWLASLNTPAEKIPVGLEEFTAAPGQPSGEGALVAWAAMERAAQGCKSGEFSGVVTGPVSKGNLAKIGYAFPGQTEFFAARWGADPVMCFCGGKLRVALATWHVPLREVASLLGLELLRRTVEAADQLAKAFPSVGASLLAPPHSSRASSLPQEFTSFTPRIGVCGLNPHAGEGGILGLEEIELLDPALDKIRRDFPGLSSCLPGDTLFMRQLRGEFDVIIALYHDQGLAPLKAVDFDEAVNVTLGLPFVRTSPDHGTAYSIAGQGKASPRSFTNAVNVARRLINPASR